jgi:hypothetical protein
MENTTAITTILTNSTHKDSTFHLLIVKGYYRT